MNACIVTVLFNGDVHQKVVSVAADYTPWEAFRLDDDLECVQLMTITGGVTVWVRADYFRYLASTIGIPLSEFRDLVRDELKRKQKTP